MTIEWASIQSFPQHGPSLPFKPLALCWLDRSRHAALTVNAVCSFQTRCLFQDSVLSLAAQNDFFPRNQAKWSHLSSARPTTHSFHKGFFDCSGPLGAFLSDSYVLRLKHSFPVLLCGRNAPRVPQLFLRDQHSLGLLAWSLPHA